MFGASVFLKHDANIERFSVKTKIFTEYFSVKL
jgi:hypothetical protein